MTNEYISKQDALKGQKTGTFANGIRLVSEPCVPVDYIESLEPADVVQVRHGHWTLVGWHKGMKIVECSCCKKRAIGATDFCPNCGAKMIHREE